CVGMPIISAFNAGNDMSKHTFRNIRPHAGTNHQGLCSATQIMNGPIRNWLNLRPFLRLLLQGRECGLIQLSLALAEARIRRFGTRRKHVVTIIVSWLRRYDSECRPTERNSGVLICTAQLGWSISHLSRFLGGSSVPLHRAAAPLVRVS